MIKYIAFILIVAVRIVYHPSPAESATTPFAKPSPSAIAPATEMIPAEVSIINNKTSGNQVVDKNETADLFDADKSVDGKSFSGAAFVSGTDKRNTANYRFYEKAGKQPLLPSL